MEKHQEFLKDNPRSTFEEIYDGIQFQTISPDPDKLARLLDKLDKFGKILYFDTIKKVAFGDNFSLLMA